ncbi:MAG: hypothetical protein A3B47_02975 [Candidatus Levybacteria bacterium RIFCSPLOWO2_01_FULL_39_24]|nr:MAG: hypothetical protein A2800_02265 [Candidatus Levybacteria bacterium RIFCSPHIGHO2_01_FULL_40_16]OGH28123.1 MAG: hypothetical protein A3E12_03695 [Candidatus Levybacteria bacterium RIFCSPHIGHO2_12_FULL_39_9]OGH46582.1 MAG: hypothetical protein A3B47_02975 [Candidatus Levybacteria bacterium RIFCSPLOWO2_01_FULL_39_24]
MKKIFILFLISHFSFLISPVFAATPTPQDVTAEIRDQLITNIASRVAQLKLVEKRGIIGKVSDVTNTQITITDLQNNTRFVDVDELTKFSSPNAKGAFGISDITKDATVGILGLYNKESRRILARFVNVITIPIIIHGGVSAIDSENFSLNIATEEGKQMTADVENLTRTYSYTQKDGYIRSGFSKIKVNFNIIVIGVLDKKDAGRLTATRIIFFPEIPSSPKVNTSLEKVQK